MTLDEAWERYRLQLTADGRSDHTVRQYGRHIRLLARWAAHTGLSAEIGALGPQELARFLASPTARTGTDGAPKTPSSVNCHRSSIRTFFGFLHRAGVLSADPARLLRRALCSPPPPRCLAEGDCDRLLEVIAADRGDLARRDHALFHMMLATGLRVGSAVALEVRDVDLRRGEIHLREAKQGRRDRVLLGVAIREHLAGYLAGKNDGPLFPGRPGAAMTTRHAARRLTLWAERAGLGPISPHQLRHTFATRLYRKTGDVLLVQAALHHRSVTSTQVYARPNEDALRAAL